MLSEALPKRVLVIDDDPMSRELLSLLLADAGYAVEAAESGEAGLALVKQKPVPDLVLTDVQMPGISGSQLARKLRRACGAQSVLLAMSGSQPGAEPISLFDSFLLKPFEIRKVSDLFLEIGKKRAAPRKTSKAPVKRKSRSSTASVISEIPTPAPSTTRASNVLMNVEMQTHPAIDSKHIANDVSAASPVLNETIYRQLAGTVPSDQLHEMYTMCVDDARRRIAGMRTLVETHDTDRFVREAHAIKGGCGMLGATELHRMASELEANGLEPGTRGEAEDVNSLDELSAACDRLERMLGSRE